MGYPTELDHECSFCGSIALLTESSINGLYDGYCQMCGEWIEFNYDEALQSEHDEQQIDARRDERLER